MILKNIKLRNTDIDKSPIEGIILTTTPTKEEKEIEEEIEEEDDLDCFT